VRGAGTAAPPPPPPGTLAPVAASDTLAMTGTTPSFSAAQLLANDTGSGISLVAVSRPASAAARSPAPVRSCSRPARRDDRQFHLRITDTFGQTALGVVNVTRVASVTVPNVVNTTQSAAQAAILAAGLTNGAVTNANSATVAAGSVISESPAAGTSARRALVTLVVSLGPALVTVPNVVNATQATAQAAILAAGLTNGAVTNASSATVAAGSVISESPAAGTSVAAGSAVTLVVSLGPALVTVPNVVNATQATAQAAILAAGLTNGAVTNANSATVAAGSVISENPAAGTLVSPGSAVALVVSLGPAAATPTVDATASSDGTGARTTPAFSTTVAGDVLVALVGSDGPTTGANTQTMTITGGGLTWTRVQRAATSRGVSEIWTATAAAVLTNVTVTSTQSVTVVLGAPVNQSIVVVAFKNASAIGATTAASATSTNATASLVPQATGSVVYGVGNDFDRAVARTVGAGQTKIHEFLAPTGDTFWMQSLNATTTAGSSVTLNATAAGAADQWNLAIVEIKRSTLRGGSRGDPPRIFQSGDPMERTTVDILLVGEQTMFREGLRRVFEDEPGFTVVGDVSRAGQAVRAIADVMPDIVIVGLSGLPLARTMQTLQELAAAGHHARTILVTTTPTIDHADVVRARQLGVSGILLSDTSPQVLFDSVRSVAAGRCWFGRGPVDDLADGRRYAGPLDEAAFGSLMRELEIADASCVSGPAH
jgi:beta-lactam-binding protein with PASTA domain/DNA-binding NarL/FixJ family response regulator